MNTHNADGSVSAYGLACGYTEAREIGTAHVTLWREHGAYHVRAHDSDIGRLYWQAFRTLGEARRAYRGCVAMLRDCPDMVAYHKRIAI